ncbi:MAG: hypothetical protein ACFN4Y_05665 [Centipeda sp. (in: firmicutes)]
MKISLKKTIAAALALLTLTAASVSAKSSTARHITSPAAAKKQLNTIAKAEPLWKDEFVARWDAGQTPQPHLLNYDPTQTRFAVTDLDGNGRLELLFRHAAMPQGIPPYPLRDIPTAVAMAVYEIGTDGHLARLPETENGYGAPDLTKLYALHQVNADGTRPYNICTRTITEDEHGHYHGTVAYQQIAIADSVVTCKLLAEESSYYNVYDIDRIEEVPLYVSICDGDPSHIEMNPADFALTEFYQDFYRIYTPPSAVHWMSGDELNRDPQEALAASWAGFVYGVIDGKG